MWATTVFYNAKVGLCIWLTEIRVFLIALLKYLNDNTNNLKV